MQLDEIIESGIHIATLAILGSSKYPLIVQPLQLPLESQTSSHISFDLIDLYISTVYILGQYVLSYFSALETFKSSCLVCMGKNLVFGARQAWCMVLC